MAQPPSLAENLAPTTSSSPVQGQARSGGGSADARRRQLRKAPMPPDWVGPKQKDLWNKPWTVAVDGRKNRAFKLACWKNGLVSPNFTKQEWASRGSDGVHEPPDSLRVGAQSHAFKLERVRHRYGRPLVPLDCYRTPIHNREVGGVPNSTHEKAGASDYGTQAEQAKFNSIMRDVFSEGGIGSGAVSGNVQHVDNGPNRRWTYPGR